MWKYLCVAVCLLTGVSSVSAQIEVHRAFVTNQRYYSDFGGLTQADAICNQVAQAQGLGGVWQAWLSSSTTNARDRLPDTSNLYVDLAGNLIAASKEDFYNLPFLENPLRISEIGELVTGSLSAWTGTDQHGIASTHCEDWSGVGTGKVGLASSIDERWTDYLAAFCTSGANLSRNRLYCLEVSSQVTECGNAITEYGEVCDTEITECTLPGGEQGVVPCKLDCSGYEQECLMSSCGTGTIEGLEACDGNNLDGETCQSLGYPSGGDLACTADCLAFDTSACSGSFIGTRVFVTTSESTGDMTVGEFVGIEGAHQKCRTAALLSEQFEPEIEWKAWLSSAHPGEFPANPDYFYHANGPYVMMNGQRIADDWNDLTDGELANPFRVTAMGVVQSPSTIPFVWTGTAPDGTPEEDDSGMIHDCQGWTNGTEEIDPFFAGSYLGVTTPIYQTDDWTSAHYSEIPAVCKFSAKLYCFEQTPPPTPVTCFHDINGNGDVDFADVLEVVTNWGPCSGCPQDLNQNGDVDFADILEVVTNWGPCA